MYANDHTSLWTPCLWVFGDLVKRLGNFNGPLPLQGNSDRLVNCILRQYQLI